MMLFSGFFVNSSSIVKWIRWLEFISPVRYALEALVWTEYDDTNFTPNPISSLGFELGYWKSIMWLGIISGIVRFLAFVALLINARTA